MLVLLSFALVLIATVLLVLGLLSDDSSLTLIYLSIGSSVAAALVLMTALRLNRPKADADRATAPEPLPEPEPERELATVGAPATSAPAEDTGDWSAPAGETWSAGDGWDEGREVDFPIADYDSLTVAQILPLLPQLYADEIPIVEERERRTKARVEVLRKLDELRAAPTAPAAAAVASEPAGDPLAGYVEPAASGAWDDDEWFPIEDYESLSAAQIQPLLSELDDEELALVRAKEASLGGRRSVLDQIDRLRGGVPAARTGASAGAARKGAAAKKSVPTKRSTPATKAPARKAPARKAAAKKAAPAKKAAAKKSTAKKSTAKKAPAKKTAAKKTRKR